MPMNNDRWRMLLEYPGEVFGPEDEQLDTLMSRAEEAGLPPIAITAGTGQLLKLLVGMTPGRVALEVGTLAGYSAIWIARGLSPEGKLFTIEADDSHADFAQQELETAGIAGHVEIIRGKALEMIPRLGQRIGPGSVDFAFIDALKEEYVDYLKAIKPLVRVGGLVTADNVYGDGRGWIDEGYGTDEFNRHVAGDPNFEATAVHAGAGLLIARRVH